MADADLLGQGLGLFELAGGVPRLLRTATFHSAEYPGLAPLLAVFLGQEPAAPVAAAAAPNASPSTAADDSVRHSSTSPPLPARRPSTRYDGRPAQSKPKNTFSFAAEAWWIARAAVSLPAPRSRTSQTGAALDAAARSCAVNRSAAGPVPVTVSGVRRLTAYQVSR